MTDPIVYKVMPVSEPPQKEENYFGYYQISTGVIHSRDTYKFTGLNWLEFDYETSEWEERDVTPITHWLREVPLSELMAEKQKEAQADLIWEMIQENQDALDDDQRITKADIESDLYDWFKKIDLVKVGAIQKLEAELSSLKSRVPEIAEKSFEAGVDWFSSALTPGTDFPDKSTFLNNLKQELGI